MSNVYVCVYKQLGRCSEVASGAIFGQKQSPLVATILSNFWLS